MDSTAALSFSPCFMSFSSFKPFANVSLSYWSPQTPGLHPPLPAAQQAEISHASRTVRLAGKEEICQESQEISAFAERNKDLLANTTTSQCDLVIGNGSYTSPYRFNLNIKHHK